MILSRVAVVVLIFSVVNCASFYDNFLGSNRPAPYEFSEDEIVKMEPFIAPIVNKNESSDLEKTANETELSSSLVPDEQAPQEPIDSGRESTLLNRWNGWMDCFGNYMISMFRYEFIDEEDVSVGSSPSEYDEDELSSSYSSSSSDDEEVPVMERIKVRNIDKGTKKFSQMEKIEEEDNADEEISVVKEDNIVKDDNLVKEGNVVKTDNAVIEDNVDGIENLSDYELDFDEINYSP
jgi:hypothetical protein